MKPNKIKSLWTDGKPVLNGWLSIANAFTAEILAEAAVPELPLAGADLQASRFDHAFDLKKHEPV